MQLKCCVLIEQVNHARRQPATRPATAFLSLGKSKMKGFDGYQIQISTQKQRNQPPYLITANSDVQLLGNFIARGRLTIQLKSSNVSIFISEANPDQLKRFANLIHSIVSGKEVQLSKSLPVKSTEFSVPSKISINNEPEKYKQLVKTGYPSTLKVLELRQCLIERVDIRWFSCKSLTVLDLSRNIIGINKKDLSKLVLVSKLQCLETLNLSYNSLMELPSSMKIPRSVVELNLSHNQFDRLPEVLYDLPSLKALDISFNNIDSVKDLFYYCRNLRRLDIQETRITCFPYGVLRSGKRFDYLGLPDQIPEIQLNLFVSQSLPSLFCWSAAAVKRFCSPMLAQEVLPATVFSSHGCHVERCTVCFEFQPLNSMPEVKIAVDACRFAVEVSNPHRMPILLKSCSKCYASVKDIFNRQANIII